MYASQTSQKTRLAQCQDASGTAIDGTRVLLRSECCHKRLASRLQVSLVVPLPHIVAGTLTHTPVPLRPSPASVHLIVLVCNRLALSPNHAHHQQVLPGPHIYAA